MARARRERVTTGRDRRDKVALRRPLRATGGPYNEPTEGEPEELGERYAKVTSTGVREAENAGGKVVAVEDFTVNLGADELARSLRPTDEVLWNGRTLPAVGVDVTRAHLGEVIVTCSGVVR